MPAKLTSIFLLALSATFAHATFIEYGDEDLCNTGTWSSDPKAGATLEGLAAGSFTMGSLIQGHGFPFSPTGSDFAGTDQIYTGANQSAFHDGYSSYAGRIQGPATFSLDYSALVPAGGSVTGLTLGIAADDFQQTVFGQPFTASVNGVVDTQLSAILNSLNQTGPVTQFFTYGLDPALLNSSHILNLKIEEGGDGGDGFAVDFLTLGGKPQQAVPEPFSMVALGGLALGIARKRRNR